MKSHYRLIGTPEQVNNFFEVTKAFQNSMPMYECIVMSSWPVAGNPKLGMCIALSEKLKNVHDAAHAIAKACGVELVQLTQHDEELAGRLVNCENKLASCRQFLEQLLTRYELAEPYGHSSRHLQFTQVDKGWIERLLK